MTDKTLHVQGAGFDRSAVNLQHTTEDLLALLELGNGTSKDVYAASELPVGALGLVGEAARLRYNRGFTGFRDRLTDGARSASAMAAVVTANKDGYAQAEHAGVRAMLALQDGAESLDRTLLQDGSSYSSANPLFPPPGRGREWQQISLLFGAAGGGLATLKLDDMMAKRKYISWFGDHDEVYYANQKVNEAQKGTWSEKKEAEQLRAQAIKSRAALQSSRTAAVLKAAAGMSFTAVMGVTLWASAIVRSDHELDAHVSYWAEIAQRLDELFGGGDPSGREALAAAWSGDAMEAADKKLRAFMTAGIQLSDRAVAHAYDLAQAVQTLNHMHDLAFALTAAELFALALVRMWYPINPVTALSLQEAIGRKLTLTVVALHTALVGIMGTVLYAGMDAQSRNYGTEGVPAQDFPMSEV